MATNQDSQYDVFLSHGATNQAVVRPLAEGLRRYGLKVWFDEWALKAGDGIPAEIEAGLEHSRVLVSTGRPVRSRRTGRGRRIA